MSPRLLRWAWAVCAFLVLLVALVMYDGTPNSDADLFLGYAMLALSLPIGLMLALVLTLLGQMTYAATGYVFTTSYFSILVTWLFFFAVGYVQWFVLLPLLWRKWKVRQQA